MTGSIVGPDKGIVVSGLRPELGAVEVVQLLVFPSIEEPDNEVVGADLGPELAAVGIVVQV